MRRQLLPAVGMVFMFTLLLGLAYPLIITGAGQLLFGERADGQLIRLNGRVIGSRLIGQQFDGPRYFHARPSAVDYESGPDPAHGSNEGPTSDRLLFGIDDPTTRDLDESMTDGVDDRVREYRRQNGLGETAEVPVDAVTGSGSGLDPQISISNARIQASRVAAARGIDEDRVLALVDQHTTGRFLGFLGEPGVNVLELNLAVDKLG